ncbi:MAG: nicotinate-nucleotide--dimethylbenzimidazole phosphoribosyltransferase [Ilumatobacteraceae bacterium]|jgi:nicotinate-nucleotide--dimethylbenzimidazole phosphoribosyltransferase|nr:nicotinate-nucleotide--dimethylbenzimidazole phosphoribosyltransferase [Ilumatobacteraceae bacterium]HQY85312.1 nicotinate-nucleotide--dimethylbenzimidazole phosphoribosyltransferase [Ilumatobacteraceae bacterium]
MSWLRTALIAMPGPHLVAGDAVRARAADILRPAGALARLDDLAAWMAEWQGTPAPTVERPAALIFAADHGVAAAGVSKYPIEVTGAMLAAFRAQQSTVTAFAAAAGATVHAVDVGVGRPTGDIRTEPALSPARFEDCVAAGRDAVDALDADLLVLGEMGIGNTTAAAAVAAALGDGDAEAWVGRGTGVDDEGLARKHAAVAAAVARIVGLTDPLEVLREVGGAELVAIAAAVMAARRRQLPVMLDGYVVTAAALPLAVAAHDALAHCQVGHCSAEPGHRRLVARLDKHPLLDLGMRLGEGSGAMAAVPLVRMACAGITQVPTFSEFFA